MRGFVRCGVNFCLAVVVAGASFVGWTAFSSAQVLPIAGSGYNQNMVLGVGEVWPGTLTATIDGGTAATNYTFFAVGQNGTTATAGLPMNSTFSTTSSIAGGDTFQLQNTGGVNAILLAGTNAGSNGVSTATFTLGSAATYNNLSILSTDGNAAASIGVTLNFVGGTTYSTSFSGFDWFTATNVAYSSSGRVNSTSYDMHTGTGQPYLHYADLTNLPVLGNIQSITFNVLNTGGTNAHIAIFGISGSTAAAPITWTGSTNNNWSYASGDKNWNTPSQTYIDFKNVVFDNSGNNTAINIATNVQPAAVTFNNSLVPYSFTGAAISGTASVTVLAGNTTFYNNNTYTGGTTVSGGSLTLATPAALQGAVAVTGGRLVLANPNSAPNSTITVSAANGIAFALGSTSATLGGLAGGSNFALLDAGSNPVALSVGNNNANTAYSGVMSGPGSLIKIGMGVTTLTGANTFNGGVAVNGGVLSVSTLGLGGTAASAIGEGPADASGQSISFNGGVLNYTGPTTGTNGAAANALMFNPNITLNSGGGTLNLVQTSATGNYVGFAGSLAGSGNLTIVDTADTTGVPGNQLFFESVTPSTSLFGSFSGKIIIGAGGNVQIRNSTVADFGPAATVYINSGGILSSDKGNAYSTGITNALVLNGGSLSTQGANMNYSGTVTATGGTTSYIGDYVNSTGSLTLGGALVGPGTLSTIGTQVVTLSGTTSGFTGTWIAKNAPTAFVGTATGGSGATWLTNGSNYLINNSGTVNFGAIGGTAGSITNGIAATSSTLAIEALGTNTTFGGTFGNGAGMLTVNKVGTGALTLTSPSTSPGPFVVSAGTLVLAQPSVAVHYSTTASVSGFGADTTGQTGQNATWTFNTTIVPTTSVTSGSLTLTDGATNEIRTAFNNTKLPVDGPFTVSFVYNSSGAFNGMADGMTFVLQNSSLTSSGTSGSGLGYASIGASAAVGLMLYPGTPTGSARGTNFFSGGALNTATISTSSAPYITGGGVVLGGESGDPIQVVLSYNGSATLTESMTDTVTLGTFSYTFINANFSALTGGSAAYIGFTGATGGIGSTQIIGDFSYTGTGGRTTVASLSGGTNTLSVATPLTVAAGATVDLFGCTQQISSLSGSGLVTSSNNGTISRLSVNGAGSSTFGGSINDGAGQVSLAVSGGTLVLSGNDSYSGGTTVNSGELIVTSPAGIQSGTNLSIGSSIGLFGAPIVTSASPVNAVPVPEPCTLLLIASALAGLLLIRRQVSTTACA